MFLQRMILSLCFICLTTGNVTAHAPQKNPFKTTTYLSLDDLTKKIHDQLVFSYKISKYYPNKLELTSLVSLKDYSYRENEFELYRTPKIYEAPPDSVDLNKTIIYYAEDGVVFVSFEESYQISAEDDEAKSSLITQRMYIILRFCALGENSSEEGANLILEMLGECQIDPIIWQTALKKMYDIFYPCISDYLLEEIDESTTLSYAHWLTEIFEEEATKLFSFKK